MSVLFPDWQTNDEEYGCARATWHALLDPIAHARRWPILDEYLTATGVPMCDGNGIFRACDGLDRHNKEFKVVQVVPGDLHLDAWTNPRTPGEPDSFESVNVSCVLAVENLPKVYRLLELWSVPHISLDQMAAVIETASKSGYGPGSMELPVNG